MNWNRISFNPCALLSLLLDLWCSFEMFQWLNRWCYPPHPAADVSPYLLHKIISSVCSTSFYPLLLAQDFGWVPQKEMMIMDWWDVDLGLLQYQGCLCPSAASVPGLLQSWLYIPHMWVTQKWLSITIHDRSDLFVVEYVKKDEQVLVFSLIYALYNTLTIFLKIPRLFMIYFSHLSRSCSFLLDEASFSGYNCKNKPFKIQFVFNI